MGSFQSLLPVATLLDVFAPGKSELPPFGERATAGGTLRAAGGSSFGKAPADWGFVNSAKPFLRSCDAF